jgi:hypothetical protein
MGEAYSLGTWSRIRAARGRAAGACVRSGISAYAMRFWTTVRAYLESKSDSSIQKVLERHGIATDRLQARLSLPRVGQDRRTVLAAGIATLCLARRRKIALNYA